MVKILDCTIRDGGHLNGWNFNEDCVRASYYAAVDAGVDYFEIGYRFKAPNAKWGKFAKCDDNFLFSLFKPKPECKISVMIDAGKCDADDFCRCASNLTPISVVRVATYPNQLDVAFRLCEDLAEKQYLVFLNFMAISQYNDENFEKIKNWQNKNVLEAVCFADSFGSFLPDDVSTYFNKLKSLGYSNIGFHSHNNLQLAFANTIRAIDEGFYCVDASIYGMGRGSGNLPVEIITGYLNKKGSSKCSPVSYIDVIERFYVELSNKTPWGYGVQSLISGLKNIHPYYVDALCDKKCFTIEEIWEKSDLIKKYAPISYSYDNLNNILSDKFNK